MGKREVSQIVAVGFVIGFFWMKFLGVTTAEALLSISVISVVYFFMLLFIFGPASE